MRLRAPRLFLLAALLLLPASFAARAGDPAPPLPWSDDLAAARREAAAAKKPIFIFFFSDDSAPCTRMVDEVFVHPAVRSALAGFVRCRRNFRNLGGAPADQAVDRDVRDVPTVKVLGPDGAEVAGSARTGFLDAAALADHLRAALARLPAGSEARTATVFLKDGRRFEGIVTERDDTVEIKLKLGTVRFPRAEIDRIERGAPAPPPGPGEAAGIPGPDLATGAPPASAKSASGVVTLKSGASFEGEIRESDDEILVESSKQKMRFKRADVERIEYRKLPAQVLREALDQTPAGDADALYRLARYAWDNDLRTEYHDILGRVLAARPDHAAAAKDMARYKKFFERLPLTAEEEAALVKKYGKAFKTVRSDHYLVVYDCDPTFALGRLSYLEKLYTTFYPYFEDRGFDTRFLPRPLTAVIFATRDEYVKAGAPKNSAGLYMPASRELWMFDPRKTVDAHEVLDAIDSVDEALKKAQEKLALAKTPQEKDETQKLIAQLKEYQLYNRVVRRQTGTLGAIDTLVHEGFHQLADNGGVLGQDKDFPVWVTEGMAEYWGRQEGWGGSRGLPGSLHTESVALIRAMIVQKRHIPLAEVMKYTNGEGYLGLGQRAALAYAEAWSLVHFMIQRRAGTRADKFFAWMREISKAKGATPESKDAAYQEAFGADLDQLEQEWIAYVRGLN